MTKTEVLNLFKETGVLKEGHFLLTSGRHSKQYLQCSQILQYPNHSAKLAAALVEKLANKEVDLCVGPAMGGITLAYEIARALNTRGIFAERQEGRMTLRRNFEVKPGEKVLVVEDVITTGGSVQEVVELVRSLGGIVEEVAVLVDRSKGAHKVKAPIKSVIDFEIETFAPEECPLCKEGIPAIKPGSRGL